MCSMLKRIHELGLSAQASHGSIVNISSIAGQRPGRGAAAYCVSKAAVDMLTKASALELGPKVSNLHVHVDMQASDSPIEVLGTTAQLQTLCVPNVSMIICISQIFKWLSGQIKPCRCILHRKCRISGHASHSCAMKLLSVAFSPVQGIRVNSINPSTVESNFFSSAGMTPDQVAGYLTKSATIHPIGRIGAPADVAELCYFLTDSAKSGWLTGQCILLDGGRLLPISTVPN